jgi:hypothetical protein
MIVLSFTVVLFLLKSIFFIRNIIYAGKDFQFEIGIDPFSILFYLIYILSFAVYILVNFAVPLDHCRNYYLQKNKQIYAIVYLSLAAFRSLFAAIFFDKSSF